MNLKDEGQTESSTRSPRGSEQQSIEYVLFNYLLLNIDGLDVFLNFIREEAPPGYIKSIVAKVINNITINCNNLILKYVEEDIVLSVNVRFLSMQTVNDAWVPAFTGMFLKMG